MLKGKIKSSVKVKIKKVNVKQKLIKYNQMTNWIKVQIKTHQVPWKPGVQSVISENGLTQESAKKAQLVFVLFFNYVTQL